MSYLLLPEDEREMVQFFCDGQGWNILDGAVVRGEPVLIPNPELVLSSELPADGVGSTGPLRVFLFWSPAWGRVTAVADAPEPADLIRRVLRRSSRDAGRSIDNVVDPHATPTLSYRRCHWAPAGDLGLGFLHGMDRPRRAWPPELRQAFGRAERWLQRGAVKVNPFDHQDRYRMVPGVATWVRPAAWEWLQDGGRISTSAF